MHMQRWLEGLRPLGGIDLEVQALARRFRGGDLALERLLLAASLGHVAAAKVAGATDPEVVVHGPEGDLVLQPGKRACVGRGESNDLRIQDRRVSSLHCTLERRGAVVQVRDLSSRNGTCLNGERFAGKTTVRAGDELLVGQAGTLWFDVRWPGVPSPDLLDVAPTRASVRPAELSPPSIDQLVADLDGGWLAPNIEARPDLWCALVERLGLEAETRLAVAAAAAVGSVWEREFQDEPSFLSWVPASAAAVETWLRCPCSAHLHAARQLDGRREPPSRLPLHGGVHRPADLVLDRRAAAYVAMTGPRACADDSNVGALRRVLNAAAFCLGPAAVLRALRKEVVPWILGYGDPLAQRSLQSTAS